ncbi:5'-3' exonuclease [Nocardia terpenica]|uniref:5'-3' exonuclease n=1 Tax=Nocardia terpenica TaxID=455432 RepID=A0A164M425_9NOCA|nr:5'-3' exonuclease [Nocardia terpenica]KZM73013.1 5'-3' exonuclease [Nocardia terpenica]MBF6061035.1 5'-3' exonuclease [Nocardia terpenica]MBF6108753.1 5'-3' exonuclease [Nocardia terpenica]MBF6114061.1 5'-3' exonuclease [Nocardia terpenica]MBF6120315.1 5'-3' exonuclease [Nocardia terpenica]
MSSPVSGPLLLLDGASLWFRAFHAIPEKITAPDGRPVNAVRGFTDMVAALITRHAPSRLVVCLDLEWRPPFRVALVPSYKAHRLDDSADAAPGAEQVPDTLTPQVDMIMEVLAAAGIATAGAEGLEADDVIGTLAHRERTDPVVVVSGDRDLLQVVRDEPAPPVRVFYAGRGLAKAELFGPAEVAAKYGVPQVNAGPGYADMATLRGDASDGLPGVPGIGDKSAAQLISRFGSLDALRAAVADPASDLARGVRAKLVAAEEYLTAAAPVVRVVTDAEVHLSGPDILPAAPADPDRLRALAAAYNAESPVQRLITALAARSA